MAAENSINNLFASTDFSYVNNISKRIRDWCLSYGYIELKLDDFLKVNDIKKVFDGFSNINKDYILFDNKKEKFILRPEPNISVIEKIDSLSKNLVGDVNYKFFCIDKFYSVGNEEKAKTDDYPYHFGFYATGQNNYIADAEIIKMAYFLLEELGFDVNVKVNIIGCSECYKKYKAQLTNFLKTKKSVLCNDCVKNLSKNPLKVLKCTNKSCKKVLSQAPLIIENLCEDCNEYSMKIVEYLDELEVSYVLDPMLVDENEIYNGFYFEFEILKSNGSYVIGSGGHLDDYANNLGLKRQLTGVSFNMSNIVKRLRDINKTVDFYKPDVYLAQISETARRKSLQTFLNLRNSGISCFCSILDKSITRQIAQAKAMGAKFILILGQQEAVDNTIIIRDIETNIQEVISYKNLTSELKRRLISKIN